MDRMKIEIGGSRDDFFAAIVSQVREFSMYGICLIRLFLFLIPFFVDPYFMNQSVHEKCCYFDSHVHQIHALSLVDSSFIVVINKAVSSC